MHARSKEFQSRRLSVLNNGARQYMHWCEIRGNLNRGRLLQKSHADNKSGPGRQWNPDLRSCPIGYISSARLGDCRAGIDPAAGRSRLGRANRVRMDLRITGPTRLFSTSKAEGLQSKKNMAVCPCPRVENGLRRRSPASPANRFAVEAAVIDYPVHLRGKMLFQGNRWTSGRHGQ